jgi:hypothetical protein
VPAFSQPSGFAQYHEKYNNIYQETI